MGLWLRVLAMWTRARGWKVIGYSRGGVLARDSRGVVRFVGTNSETDDEHPLWTLVALAAISGLGLLCLAGLVLMAWGQE